MVRLEEDRAICALPKHSVWSITESNKRACEGTVWCEGQQGLRRARQGLHSQASAGRGQAHHHGPARVLMDPAAQIIVPPMNSPHAWRHIVLQDFLSGWSSSRSRGLRGQDASSLSPPPPSSWRRGTSYQVFVLPQRAPDVPRRLRGVTTNDTQDASNTKACQKDFHHNSPSVKFHGVSRTRRDSAGTDADGATDGGISRVVSRVFCVLKP